MKKILKFSDIDCANCAAKVEKNISKLDNVEAKKVEPDCEIVEKN